MRSKISLAVSLLIIVLSFSLAVLADTIHLKDGTTVKGKVVGFRDQQFVILVGDGSRGGRRSEMRLYPEDIDYIEFDGNSAVVPNNTSSTNTTTTPVSTSNNNTSTTSTASNSRSNDNGDDDNAPIVVGRNSNGSSSASNPRPSNSSGGSISQVINSRPPVSSSSSSSSNPNSGSNNPMVIGNSTNNSSPVSTTPVSTTPVSSSSASTVSRGKPVNLKLKVLADNTANGWTNAGIVVKKGQRLKILSNGRVALGNGRFATPAGVASLPDKDKLMQNEPTGSLIAVIGDNNNDFIFIGSSREFIAQRDGILFLGVNEGNLNDNSGAFETSIEVEDVK
jgi:PA-IL-like protein